MADGAKDSVSTSLPEWPQQVFELLKDRGVTTFCHVPDAGHKAMIELAERDSEVVSVPLTTEEEGIGLIAGVDLGLGRAVLLLQSSGVGNCVNALSLVKVARFPMLLLVSMRGDFGEGNPWQFAMGEAVEPVLHAMGVVTLRVDHPSEVVAAVEAASTMVFQGGQAVAVLLTQRLLGAKRFGS